MKTNFKFSRALALVIAVLGVSLTATSCDPEEVDGFIDGFYEGYYGKLAQAQANPNNLDVDDNESTPDEY